MRPEGLPAAVQRAVSLRAFNTFGLEAVAEYFVEVRGEAELQALLRQPTIQALPKYVLGGGSNVLLVGNIEGLVIRNLIKGMQVMAEDASRVWLAAGGGEAWHALVMQAIDHGWGGLENLSLIPGSVGAAPIQNIGAYGVEVKDVVSSVRAIHLQTGELRSFGHPECMFGYRDSVFKRDLKGQFMITGVTFALQKAPHRLQLDYGAIRDELAAAGILAPTIRDVSAAVIAIRRSKLPDPAILGNAGSFFKNPEVAMARFEALQAQHPGLPGYKVDGETMKIPAGWLIEQAGWKGMSWGNHGVHAQQALVLVNYGGAEGRDILSLSTAIMEDIQARFGILLEREVNVIGG
jgi:UDP-N-acetylmuramate dehydrogenase